MYKTLPIGKVLSSRFRRLGREIIWIGMGQVLAVLGGLVGVRVITELLNPTMYGELALGMTAGGLVTQLVFGPLQQGILRFFGAAMEANKLRDYLLSIRALIVWASAIILGIAGLVLIGLYVASQTAWIGLAMMSFLLALVSSYERVLDAMQSAARQRVVVAWHQVLSQWLRFLLAIGLISWLGALSSIAMLGYILATSIVLISQVIFFRRKFGAVVLSQSFDPVDDVKKWSRRIKNYSWPFMTWGIFLWLQQSSDRWALQTFSQTSDVGYYAVLLQLGYLPIILFTGIFVQFFQPILFGWAGDGDDPLRLNRARQINVLVIIAFLALAGLGAGLALVLHTMIFALLVAPEYRGISLLMPWMVLSGGFFASSEVAALLLMTAGNTRRLIVPKIGTGVLGVIFNIAGAYWLGLRGVVFASVGYPLISLIWILVLSNRSKRVEMDQAHHRVALAK